MVIGLPSCSSFPSSDFGYAGNDIIESSRAYGGFSEDLRPSYKENALQCSKLRGQLELHTRRDPLLLLSLY